MTVTSQHLQEMYELFNGDDSAAIVNQFAPDAVYTQVDSKRVATGRDEIADIMAGWKTFFANATIGSFQIEPADNLASGQAGAVQCFVVSFVGHGRYVKTIPGLEQVAPARGQEVELPLSETVWLNGTGQFIRVDNTMNVRALA